MFKYFKGFTLAEILITLTVIGVVSALTLPNVMKKYNEFVIKKRFAKFYSNISQAFARGYNDNGMTWNCYYALNNNSGFAGWNGNWTVCMNEGKEVFKYLKVIKKCRYTSGENNCIKSYPRIQGSNFSDNYYFLSDGSIIITPHDYALLYFAVDINGAKGPNKNGYDIFWFITARDGFTKNKFYIAPYPNHSIYEGGKTTKEMLENFNN